MISSVKHVFCVVSTHVLMCEGKDLKRLINLYFKNSQCYFFPLTSFLCRRLFWRVGSKYKTAVAHLIRLGAMQAKVARE
jgi:hypothetical protein